MDNNIIQAAFDGLSNKARTRAAFQYDYGMLLQVDGIDDLPAAFEAHFSNEEKGESTTQIGSDGVVTIPDAYFLSGKTIYVWIYLHSGSDDGETVYRITIPVMERAAITSEQPDPVEQSAITQAIAALNEAVTKTGEDSAQAEAAAESAADSASDAEAWAVGRRGGSDVSPGDPTYHNNSKHYAEVAAQHADTAGYAWFDVNDEDGQMYVTVANNLDNDLRFEIDENTGNLEVVIR